MKAIANKFQSIYNAGTPVLPVMHAITNTKLMRHFFFGEHDMKITIAFYQEIIITAINPVPHFFQLIGRFCFYQFGN